MPRLVRLYLISIAVGFGLSAAFLALVLVLDIGQLQRLILRAPGGFLAGLMIWIANGIVFSGAQFAIAVMGMARPSGPPAGGGTRAPLARAVPVPQRAQGRAHAPTAPPR